MSDLSKYAGRTWGDVLRWDRNLPNRPELARDVAKAAADGMRRTVDAIEAQAWNQTPRAGAALRDAFAPLYYDLQRAQRVADGTELDLAELVEQHLESRRLAAFIANQRPAMLNPGAAGEARDGTSEDDYAREYMLFAHTLLLEPVDAWPDGDEVSGVLHRHMNLEEWTIDATRRFDRTLRLRLGILTRSPFYARAACAAVTPGALLRGVVTRPFGDIVAAETGDAITDENEVAYLAAMSLGMRHLKEAQRGFDAGLRTRAAGNRDKSLHVSASAILAGEHRAMSPIDDAVGHYPTEFGRALSLRPEAFPGTPTQESADHARRIIA